MIQYTNTCFIRGQYRQWIIADKLLKRGKYLIYEPIVEKDAVVIRCDESRIFFAEFGISKEIIHMLIEKSKKRNGVYV